MPVSGHWHLRHRTEEYLERRSQEIDATEPAVHALTPDRAVAEWKRLEPPRDRPRAAAAARVLRPHADLPGHRGRRRAARPRRSAGSARRRDRPGRRGAAAGPRAGRAGGARPGGQDRRSRRASACSAPPTPGGCSPPARARLPGPLAELGDELGAAARASTATCPRGPPDCSEHGLRRPETCRSHAVEARRRTLGRKLLAIVGAAGRRLRPVQARDRLRRGGRVDRRRGRRAWSRSSGRSASCWR